MSGNLQVLLSVVALWCLVHKGNGDVVIYPHYDFLHVKTGTSMRLTCLQTNTKEVSAGFHFSWYRHDLHRFNELTKLVGNHRMRIKSTPEASVLQLFNTTTDDTGVYRCTLDDDTFDFTVVVIDDTRPDENCEPQSTSASPKPGQYLLLLMGVLLSILATDLKF